jgi:hypothetical protein
MKEKINEVETDSKNKNVRDLYSGIKTVRRILNLELN